MVVQFKKTLDPRQVENLLYMSLAALADKIAQSATECTIGTITCQKLRNLFKLSVDDAQALFDSLLGRNHRKHIIPVEEFFAFFALFSRDDVNDTADFIQLCRTKGVSPAESVPGNEAMRSSRFDQVSESREAAIRSLDSLKALKLPALTNDTAKKPFDPVREYDWVFESLLDGKSEASSLPEFISECYKAMREFLGSRLSDDVEVKDRDWRNVLKNAFEKQKSPDITFIGSSGPSSVPSKKRLSVTYTPKGFFSDLSTKEIAALQSVWVDCGGQNMTPVDMRVFMNVIRSKAKTGTKEANDFLDKVIALLRALGEDTGLLDGQHKFEELTEFLAPGRERKSPISSSKQQAGKQQAVNNEFTELSEQPDTSKVMTELRAIYDRVLKYGTLESALDLREEDKHAALGIDISSFEAFVSTFLPENFERKIANLEEWSDLIETKSTPRKKKQEQSDDFPKLLTDKKTAELEDKLRRSKKQALRLALNELTFSPKSPSGKI